MPNIVPNMGIVDEMEEPPSVDHLYRDPRADVLVQIAVVPDTSHWMIIWQVGYDDAHATTIHRRIHIVQEVGYQHFTNWGPITASSGVQTQAAERVDLKMPPLTTEEASDAISVAQSFSQ